MQEAASGSGPVFSHSCCLHMRPRVHVPFPSPAQHLLHAALKNSFAQSSALK